MIEAMRQLLKLEGIDGEIAALDASLAAIQEERAQLEKEEVAAAQKVSQAEESVETQDLEMRKLEGQMRDQEALLERLEGRSGQVTSKQAYDALVAEMDDAREAHSGFETEALLVMETLDEARSGLAAAEDARSDLATRATKRRAELLEAEQAALADRSAKAELRAKEAERLEAKLLARYDRIGLRRRPAVTVFSGTACPACHTAVPAQRLIEIRRLDEIFECADCHRLLLPEQAFED